MIWTCSVCGCFKDRDEVPTGWATGHATICSADCMRELYSGLAIAVIFPVDATDDELEALREHEDVLMRRTASTSKNPTMVGALAGSLFKQREERARLREEVRR